MNMRRYFILLLILTMLAISCAPRPGNQILPAGQKAPEVNWLDIPLKDAVTQKQFKLSDFKGKVVMLETMAVWCTTCIRQQIEMRTAHSQFGDEVVSITLDIDPNENEELLKQYALRNGLNWIFAVSPPLLSQQLDKKFGNAILNPPSTPVVMLDKNQSAHLLRFGLKSSQELASEISKYR